ncbi:C2 domain-containing protein [Lactarius indigo]|nr:C2 domain-containing protein [Lactarius indigo]
MSCLRKVGRAATTGIHDLQVPRHPGISALLRRGRLDREKPEYSQIDQIGLLDSTPFPTPSAQLHRSRPRNSHLQDPPTILLANKRVFISPMVSSNPAQPPVSGKDNVGIVVLHIYGAKGLPKWPNAARTSWDMDPFVKVSIGEETKSTRVIRHELEPVWDEELLFHVCHQDLQHPIRLAVFDWDRFTRNDLVGSAEINVDALVNGVTSDPNSGLHPAGLPSVLDFTDHRLVKNSKRAYLSTPTITFRASYQSYATLQKQAEQKS